MGRFWVWSSYVPFSLAVSLVFFGHFDGETVLILLLLSTIIVHLLLNRIESRLLPQTDQPRSHLPQSKILQLLIGVCLGGSLLPLFIKYRPNATISDQAGNFFSDLLTPWMFGSFASQVPLVAFGSLLSGVTYIHCVTPVQPRTAPLAKASLLVLLLLSLFTIWVSSSALSTAEEVSGFAVETILKKMVGMPVDLGMTFVWVAGLIWAFAAIRREQAQHRTDCGINRDRPPLWVKLVCLVVGWASLIGAILISLTRA